VSKEVEYELEKVPVVNWLVRLGKKVKILGLEGMTLYDLFEMYILGIVNGALTSRAGGISYSFFMALFPFMLFILTLIPFIPIEGFQENLMELIEETLPPETYGAVESVLNDIANTKYTGLLSFGFILSFFLMANGVNAIFGGFEYSYHVEEIRTVLRSYLIALGVSLIMSIFLLVTIIASIVFEIGIEKLNTQGWLQNTIFWISNGRTLLFIFMIFTTVSTLYRFGTKQGKKNKFLSPGAILTTLLYIFTFYLFEIYVLKFANYNELYGSIGTLLVIMLFIWLNSIILLLGFELNASIIKLKRRHARLKKKT